MDPTIPAGTVPRRLRGPGRVAEPTLRFRRRDVSWLLPTTLLVGIFVGDLNTPESFRMITWVALVPAIASAVCRLRTTVVFAIASVVAFLLSDATWPHVPVDDPADMTLVVAAGVLSALACSLRLRAIGRLVIVEKAAEATRLAVLHPVPPLVGGLESASVYLSADVAARIGGDFFDIQPSRHGPRVLLGDVQGKGTTAVDAAAALLGTFREMAYHEPALVTVAEFLENSMRRQNERDALLGRGEERFATAVLVGFPPDPEEHWLELVNFGHPGPMAVGGPEGVRTLPEGLGYPIGLARLSDADAGPPTVVRVPFAPNETLVLFTDGVDEARDRAGAFFPLTDHLAAATDTSPQALVSLIHREVLAHTRGHLEDDTAILAVRRSAEGRRQASARDPEVPASPPPPAKG